MGRGRARKMGVVGAAALAVAGLALSACGGAGAGASTPATAGGSPGDAAGHLTRPGVSTTTAGASGSCAGGGPTVTAHGTGMAQAAPDLLTITLGVHTQDASANAALADNNTKAQSLISSLEKDGVAAADVQTSGLSISPSFNNGSPPTITGYQVDDTVTARVRQLGSAGRLIDDAAASVGNAVRVEGLQFSLQDDSVPAGAARTSAVHQAQAQARAMATAAGATLGRLCSVSDTGAQQVPPPFIGYSTAGASAGAGALAPVPVQAGSQQISADVTVVYALVQG